MPAKGRALTSDMLSKKPGEAIGDEPANAQCDPDASEEALPQGEGRTAS
jgi:hypothetical protein